MERTHCPVPTCRALAPPGAIGCDRCGIIFGEYDRAQADALRQIDSATAERIARRATRRMWKQFAVIFTVLGFVLGGVLGLNWWAVIRHIDTAINEQFAQPRVAETLERVASEKAAELLSDRVEPAVKGFENELEETRTKVAQSAEQARTEFRQDLEDLRGQVNYLKQFRDIQSLEAHATDGDVAAYQALVAYQSQDPDLRFQAQVALLRLQMAYLGHTRAAGGVGYTRDDGTTAWNDQMTTEEMIYDLRAAGSPFGREKAAILLRGRPELGVPEALLQAMQTDQDLWVRHDALETFKQIAGFSARELFAFDEAAKWYSDHREDVNKRLKPQQPSAKR